MPKSPIWQTLRLSMMMTTTVIILFVTVLGVRVAIRDSAVVVRGWVPPRIRRRLPRSTATRMTADGGGGGTGTKEATAAAATSRFMKSRGTIRRVLENVGSGSYGTVHMLDLVGGGGGKDEDGGVRYIGKRAWTMDELREQHPEFSILVPPDDDNNNQEQSPQARLKDKYQRCRTYFDVEVHCFRTLRPHPSIPKFVGVMEEEDSDQSPQPKWMVFEFVENGQCLDNILKQEHDDHKYPRDRRDLQDEDECMYPRIRQALGYDDDIGDDNDHDSQKDKDGDNDDATNKDNNRIGWKPLTRCVDVLFTDLLRGLVHVHGQKIVHRDIKPGNILLKPRRRSRGNDSSSSSSNNNNNNKQSDADIDINDDDDDDDSHVVLLDFGSAADLNTAGLLKANVGLGSDRVAISPIYTAPEVFINPSIPREAMTFDCFSSALLICQLLFQLTDERTDAGFHQQLQSVEWNLDAWLNQEMQGKVTPIGLDTALMTLGERPGLWKLLQDMLHPNPSRRLSSSKAFKRWKLIQQYAETHDIQLLEQHAPIFDDGVFFKDVLESLEVCILPAEDVFVATPARQRGQPALPVEPSRPLHYIASFRRDRPLGLVLSEAYDVGADEGYDDFDGDTTARRKWEQATSNAQEGAVYVKGIAPGGQADEMGIFAIGDRLQGVGELPLANGGFEKAVKMLQDQPRSSSYVTLHFDRQSALVVDETAAASTLPFIVDAPIQPKDQGAWSICGRRPAQEDQVVIHEVHDTTQRSILLMGVMDGHLGRAASTFVGENLPRVFSDELLKYDAAPSEELLERAWDDVCAMYRSGCSSGELCSAEYNPREGTLQAFTGSEDAAAGTTACVMALDMQTSHLAVLNCGDSRGLILDADGKIRFRTVDHSPATEIERFELGRRAGLDYSVPECRLSRWSVAVGDYTYAVSRSLEGQFATSKGIVSTPDVTLIQAVEGMTAVVATDGFWEVIDSEEAARILKKIRAEQQASGVLSAGDAAKALCASAYKKGSSDNISVVVLYL